MIFSDIIFGYKNFIHWNISKLAAFLWSIVLGFIISLPIIILVCIIAIIDPVDWIAVLWAESFLGQLQDIENILWSLAIFFLSWIAFIFFFIGSSYYVIFLLKLFHSYIDRKPVKYKKLLSVNKKELFCFLRITVFSCLCIFFPVFVWTIVGTLGVFFIGPAFESNFLVRFMVLIVYALIIYIAYKVQFSYIIFAKDSKKKKNSFHALHHIKESIKISKPKHFVTFLMIMFLYFIILLPFRSIDTVLERNIGDMQNTYNFRNDLFTGLTDGDREYLSLVASEYEALDDLALISEIRSSYHMRIIHFIISYILFWGLILLIATSFYRRILLKK